MFILCAHDCSAMKSERALDSLELGCQAASSHLLWVVLPKPRPSTRVAIALNHWPISPAPNWRLLNMLNSVKVFLVPQSMKCNRTLIDSEPNLSASAQTPIIQQFRELHTWWPQFCVWLPSIKDEPDCLCSSFLNSTEVEFSGSKEDIKFKANRCHIAHRVLLSCLVNIGHQKSLELSITWGIIASHNKVYTHHSLKHTSAFVFSRLVCVCVHANMSIYVIRFILGKHLYTHLL